MSDDPHTVKEEIRKFLRLNLDPVDAQRVTSGKVHLEVWRAPDKPRAVGLEMGHSGQVNLWLARQHVPPDLPDSVARFEKEPTVNGWTDGAGKGANSNLHAYSQFRGKKISRLEVTSVRDAVQVLESLLK